MQVSWERSTWSPLGVIVLVGALALPQVLHRNAYLLFVLDTVLIFALLAMGLQLVLGFGGILQLGYAGFFGLGAYASALLATRFGFPFLAAFVGAVVVATLGGGLMSPIIRLRDVYFAMASFVFGLILELVFNQWSAVTNGPIGFRGIPLPTIAGFTFQRPEHFYYLLLTLVVMVYIAFSRLLASPFGTALQAMRESETACASSGVHVAGLKVRLILISSAVAGGAGSLLAHMNGFISPPSFGWSQSVILVMMVVVGGLRSLPAALLGAATIRLLLERTSILGRQSNIIFGLVLIIFMMFLPRGLAGLWQYSTLFSARLAGMWTRRLQHERSDS